MPIYYDDVEEVEHNRTTEWTKIRKLTWRRLSIKEKILL
jgi:hypothetical protein